MRKFYFFLVNMILLNAGLIGQVTVTNPGNVVPALSGTYPNLDAAIIALNTRTNITGPVTIALNAGFPQTTPMGGYTITAILVGASAANTVTFAGNANTITAFTPQAIGNLNDAIFKIIGSDFVTIQNFVMQENALNVTNTPATSNNMTEWGVALLRASITDGAQNNTIKNNTISLNRTYTNTFGVYSNVRHSATAPTSTVDITNVSGSNFGNKIYNNAINNVNYGVVFNGSSDATQMDSGNDIGGSSAATGNTFTNWGTGAALSGYIDLTSNNYCIFVNHQINDNISYNTITSATHTAINTLGGILKNYSVLPPSGTITTTINNNTVTLTKSAASGAVIAINSQGITSPLSTSTITINSNNILNCVISGSGSSNLTGIMNLSLCGALTINGNIIRGNVSNATSGNFTGISNSGAVVNTINITNNQIGNAAGGAIAFSAATTGTISGIFNSGAVATTTINLNTNTIQGISTVTAGQLSGINNTGPAGVTININNNNLGSASSNFAIYSAATASNFFGLSNSGGVATTTINLNGNTIQGISAVSIGQLIGVVNTGNAGVAINMNNNNLGSASSNFVTYSAATAGVLFGYFNSGGVVANTVISISNNNIRGIVNAVTASTNHQYLTSGFPGAIQNTNNNNFINITANTTGDVIMIIEQGNKAATAVETCNNNSIVTGFNKTGAGGSVYFFYSQVMSVNGATITQTGNNFSNVTLTGATSLTGWYNVDGASSTNAPTKTITGNTFSNITGGTSLINVMHADRSGLNSSVSSNTISNITGNGNITGIFYSTSNNQGTHAVSFNSISNLSSTGTGGLVTGISAGATTTTTLNVNNNTITGLSTTGASSAVVGLQILNGAIVNANSNIINTITGSGGTSPFAAGIAVASGTTVNLAYNKIHTISETALITTTSPAVVGISLTGGVNVTTHNNFVANLNAVNANLTDAIRGISVTSTTLNSTYNLYYNSIHINSTSAVANFGTSGVYHTTSATATTAALNMIDNIIVNTSASSGTGFTAAYRRSTAILTNFASTSDYNLLYASTPSATNVIFYDGTNTDITLAAYRTRVSTRDANSISLMPAFVSATDLHLTTANCGIDGKGTPIAITTDIDAATRDVTTPDIGADEFTATYSSTTLAGVAGTAVCDSRTVDTAPTVTTYATSNCDLIAKVLQSGADPVAGRINVCVTRDATQLNFNGDRYVQRHYDVEPATSNTTTTSATLTLYFTDAEFVQYNTNNPVRPPLPTIANNTIATRNNVKVTQFHGTPTGGLPTSTPGNYTAGFALIIPGAANVVLNGSVWAVTFSITGFSGFYVHTNNYNAPLPIIVNYLTGRRQGSSHLLNWKLTCVSTPKATMTLERSADSRNFTGITTITADAARCNQPFDYTDANPLKGMNYYRLKMVDADGKVTYSITVALLNAVKGFDIVSIAPNPVVDNNFKLNVTNAVASKMEITIIDMQGRLVSRQTISAIAGYNSLLINVSNLATGTYTIQATVADEKSRVIRFVKQ